MPPRRSRAKNGTIRSLTSDYYPYTFEIRLKHHSECNCGVRLFDGRSPFNHCELMLIESRFLRLEKKCMQGLRYSVTGQGRTDTTGKQERSERGQTAQVVQQDQLGSAAEYSAARK
jgi:hypothetical protein